MKGKKIKYSTFKSRSGCVLEKTGLVLDKVLSGGYTNYLVIDDKGKIETVSANCIDSILPHDVTSTPESKMKLDVFWWKSYVSNNRVGVCVVHGVNENGIEVEFVSVSGDSKKVLIKEIENLKE